MSTGVFATRMGQGKNKYSASRLTRFLLFFCQSQLAGIIRANLGNLIRCAHPFGAALRHSVSLHSAVVSFPPTAQRRGLLKNYPEVRLEISESGHGFMLSFRKVAPQPESQQITCRT